MDSLNKVTVGINSFVKRQIKGSGKTYSTLSFELIRKHAEDRLNLNKYKQGYREGVVLVSVETKLLIYFICPIVKINSSTQFESTIKRRRQNEELYISTKATNGKPITITAVDLILYRNDVLKETDENDTNKHWELIAFQAIPEGVNEMPMGPITMMRNQLCLEGGTKAIYKTEEWANSVYFWQKYALLKQ